MRPCNFIIYTWHKTGNHWVKRSRHADPLEAARVAGGFQCTAVVIDLLPGRVIWQGGKFCNRKRPAGIKSLPPIETYLGGPQ